MEDTRTIRLMITRMVLENFKSYAGVQEIGPFHKRFSSIVGPNGSGKSNVIDALLFVFGKRAKQLRLNKVSELIHNSSRYPNLEYAKVEIHFQLIRDDESSQDDFEVVSGSEFIVSRIAYKNNESKYTVDGKKSSYTDVGQLLRSHSIDLDNNRFLILQGEVEQIAMMKPKAQVPHEDGLLEYLEDIIGSNRFVEKIEESSKIVDALNEARIEKVKRLQLAQSDRDGLQGPRDEAYAFLVKEAEIRHKLNVLYQIYIHEANVNLNDLEERKKVAVDKLTYERSKMADSESKLNIMKQEYTQINAEYDKLVEVMTKTSEDFTAYERRDTKMMEDMKFLKSSMQKAQTNITKEARKIEDCQNDITKTQNEITELANSMETLVNRKQQEESHLDDVMAGLQESTSGLREALEHYQADLIAADRSVSELQTQKESMLTALELIDSRSTSANRHLKTALEKLDQLAAEVIATNKSLKDMQVSKVDSTQRLAALMQTSDSMKQNQVDIQNQLKTTITQCEEAKATLQMLNQGDGGAETRSEVIAIMKETAPGKSLARAGVRGRLGDLGTIDMKYDVAISTACGMLDSIVVDTADGATACIQYLRDNNKGRATFIVLNQLADFRERMNNKTGFPSSSSRLFDLITPKNEAVKPAFYMALKETLVVRDLDTAVSIAYEGDRAKWRVVTEDGNLIDTSGSMSGGGKSPKSGGMRPVVSNGDKKGEVSKLSRNIELYEESIRNLQTTLSQCRSDLTTVEREIKETNNSLKRIEVDMEKLKMALDKLTGQENDLNNRINTLRNEVTLTPAEMQQKNNFQSQINDLSIRMSEMSPNRDHLQQQVQAVQQQILDIGGPKLKRAQSKVDSATSDLDNAQKQLSEKEVTLATSQKQIAKAKSAFSKAESEMEKLVDRKTALEKEKAEMEVDAEQVLLAQEQAKELAHAKENDLTNIKASFDKLSGDMVIIRNVVCDLENARDEIVKSVKENEQLVKQWTSKLDSTRKSHAESRTEQIAVNNISHCDVASLVSGGVEEAKADEAQSEMMVNPNTIDDETEVDAVIRELPTLAVMQLMEYLSMFASHKSASELEKNYDMRKSVIEKLKKEINVMEADRDRNQGNVNLEVLAQYRKKELEYKARAHDLDVSTEQRNVARRAHEDLRRQRLEEFMQGFGVISLKLKEMYQMITLGGDAELELVDSLDPFSEGIVFSVRPPKKSWKHISNLSGGEKTLSSLALVFALHHYKPTPLYVMDEIDAALDFKNVSIVANYIKERTKNAQFIIISLRNNMFELADRLVGIYKTNDATKSVTINPASFQKAIEHGEKKEKESNSSAAVHNPNTEENIPRSSKSVKLNGGEQDTVESNLVKKAKTGKSFGLALNDSTNIRMSDGR